MPTLFSVPPLILGVIALAPAAVRWWLTRGFASALDDPLLPEKLWAARARGRSVLALAMAVLVVLAPRQLVWTLPLMIVARAAVSYPLRRALYGETWTLPAYLWFFGRLIVAAYGFWLLLCATPALTLFAPDPWLTAAILGAVLVAWNACSVDAITWLLRSRAVNDPELVARFAALVQRAGIPAPRFEIVDMRGGVVANAIALRSLRKPAVVVTSTLVERLDRDEVTAICGHELAHVEQYDRARLWRLNAGNLALVASGALAGPIANRVDAFSPVPVVIAWFIAFVVVLAARARTRQKDETASDLRAVALTGDPDALVRALTKLHAIGRVPRRWETEVERRATHPSLARRIQAIRAAARQSAPHPVDPRTIVSGASSVTFLPDRLQWNEGELATHSFAYAHLSELRLDAGSGGPKLVAVERSGRRWELALAAADVAGVQSALDAVDGRLAPAHAGPPLMNRAPLRLVCTVATAFALLSGQMLVVVPALLAAAKPAAPIVAAAAAALLAAALGTRGATMYGMPSPFAWSGIVLAGCGVVLALIAWTLRREDRPAHTGRSLALIAACAAVACWSLAMSGANAVRLHQVVRDSPGIPAILFALAAGLAWMRARTIKLASIPVAAAAFVVAAVGTNAFVTMFGHDPFLASAPSIPIRTVSGRAAVTLSLPLTPVELRLSPNGRSIALKAIDLASRRTVFHVGRAAGPWTTIAAENVLFVDDDRLLVLQQSPAGVTVASATADDPSAFVWTHQVDGAMAPKLWYSRATSEWRLLAHLQRERQVTVEQGAIGCDACRRQRWTADDATFAGDDYDDGPGPYTDAVSATSSHVLMARMRYLGGAARSPWLLAGAALLNPPWSRTELWTIGAEGVRPIGTSEFELDCAWKYASRDSALCAAFDGRDTTLFAVDVATAARSPLGSLPGRILMLRDDGGAWLSGWSAGGAIAVRTDGAEALRVAPPDRSYVRTVVAGDTVVGAVVSRGAHATLQIYDRASR